MQSGPKSRAEKMGKSVKNTGQIFTPTFIVEKILDFCNYRSGNINGKHVMDNSCGRGAFLCEITRRYIEDFLSFSDDREELARQIERFVHGIEIDRPTYKECIRNLNCLIRRYGIGSVNWDIECADALNITRFDGYMDFVIGNPPYVRVHNLQKNYETVKKFEFAAFGMTDLFLAFFEIGFRMLSPIGILCYITPSSWLSSLAGKNMRRYILKWKNMTGIIDMGHYQPFASTTYSMISRFANGTESDNFEFYTFDTGRIDRTFVSELSYEDILIDDKFYLGDRNSLRLLRNIKENEKAGLTKVKHGLATLADKIFIGDFDFDEYVIPIIKASTGEWNKGIFPYNADGEPVSWNELSKYAPLGKYMLRHKKKLLERSSDASDDMWYLYGRSQAVKDISKYKIAINTCIKDIDSIKLNPVPAGSGVYSGLYILTDRPFADIEFIVRSNDFINYIRSLKKYKNGGYYTFSSEDLKQYIDFKLNDDLHE